MANNAANVSNAKPKAAGAIHSAAVGTTLPTDPTTALDADFAGLGYVSDDGLTNGIEIDTNSTVAWGGDTVLNVRTSYAENFSWTFIETNEAVLKEVYGQDNVTVTGGVITVLHKGSDLPERAYVFEIAMTGNRVKRIVVPRGKVTEIGDVQYVDGDPIGYEVTLSTTPDEDGVTVYEYIATVGGGGGGGGEG